MKRRLRILPVFVALAMVGAACNGDASDDDPIVVGGSLALEGAVAATGIIHEIAGQLFIDRLNENGGLLGRQVEWIVLNDESDPTRVGDLYEQLITDDEVDLIMGPYATPWVLQAQPVAERHDFVLPQHTSVLAPSMEYECQFPGWSIGPEPNQFIPHQVADALDTLDDVSTVALVTNSSGSTAFVTDGVEGGSPGALEVFPERGYEVVANEAYPPGETEWGPIAVAIRDADPDFVMVNGLGVEANQLIDAMGQLDYAPGLMFSLFPAPGAVLGLGEAGEGMLSVSMFEPNEPILAAASAEVREIVEEFQSRAEAHPDVLYTTFETQAAASWNAWEILTQGVEGAGSLDHREICDYLLENGATLSFGGHVSFPREDNNFWPTNQVLKQVQDGDWVVVWPEADAAADLRGPGG